MDAGMDAAGTDARSTLSTAELLQLAVDGMDAQAQVVEQVCDCGFCERIIRISTDQARCFLAQANGDTTTFQLYFELLLSYSRTALACAEGMFCMPDPECGTERPELLRNPPEFYFESLTNCL